MPVRSRGLGDRGTKQGGGLMHPATGYVGVYLIEIVLLFVTLAVVGPLVRRAHPRVTRPELLTGSGLAGPAPI